jgi:Anti-sigma factor NepR
VPAFFRYLPVSINITLWHDIAQRHAAIKPQVYKKFPSAGNSGVLQSLWGAAYVAGRDGDGRDSVGMMMPESRSSHSARAARRPRRPSSPGRTKEDWIAEQLRRVYDEAIGEDIPPNMLDLLRQLDDADPKQGASDEEEDSDRR